MLLHPLDGKLLAVRMVRSASLISSSWAMLKKICYFAGLRLFKEATDWDSYGRVTCIS